MRTENLRGKVAALLIFTLICAVTFVYLFTSAGGRLRTSSPYHGYVLVPDALNIVLNSDVREDGIKIGRVRAVEPHGGISKIKYEIETKSETPLYQDATVRVRTKTLVGESYLDIDRGTPSKGPLKSGSTLPLNAAKEAVPLERILNSLDPKTRQEIRNNMKGLGDGLKGHGGQLNELFGALQPTVADGGKLMNVLKPQKQELAGLLRNTGVVLQAFGERTQAFRGLVVDAKATAEAAASRDEKLRESIRELPATLRQAQSTVNRLASFSRTSAPVFADLTNSSIQLAPAMRDLGPAARDTRTLFRELNPFLTAINPLIAQLKPASKSLTTVVRPLDTFLRQLNPALGYLSPYYKEFGSFFSNVGSVFDKDALGYHARVDAIVGKEDLASMPPQLQQVFEALSKAGIGGALGASTKNVYPKPGDVGQEKPGDGSYTRVEEAP